MSIFEAFDQEYASLSNDISKKIQELTNLSEKDKPQGFIRQIEGLFGEVQDTLKQMEIESRSHDGGTKLIYNVYNCIHLRPVSVTPAQLWSKKS
jgi:Vesicle transport v-SNARE protein N-terminus